MAARKVDLEASRRKETAATRSPALVTIKPAKYLVIQGKGRVPGDDLYRDIGALMSVAFTVKMASKFAGRDYVVCKLEGLWWGPKTYPVPDSTAPRPWNWKLLILTPAFVTPRAVKTAIASLLAKGKPADVKRVALEPLSEGRCVQVLHVGPYTAEAPTIEAMKAFAIEKGFELHGRHHEIYLSDPRRVAPAKLKTILRHPVR